MRRAALAAKISRQPGKTDLLASCVVAAWVKARTTIALVVAAGLLV